MRLKSKVTEEGVLLPKKLFRGIKEVEIRRKNNAIVVVPIEDDPIFQLGSRPVAGDVFEAMREAIEPDENLRELRAAKEKSAGDKSIPLSQVISDLGL